MPTLSANPPQETASWLPLTDFRLAPAATTRWRRCEVSITALASGSDPWALTAVPPSPPPPRKGVTRQPPPQPLHVTNPSRAQSDASSSIRRPTLTSPAAGGSRSTRTSFETALVLFPALLVTVTVMTTT